MASVAEEQQAMNLCVQDFIRTLINDIINSVNPLLNTSPFQQTPLSLMAVLSIFGGETGTIQISSNGIKCSSAVGVTIRNMSFQWKFPFINGSVAVILAALSSSGQNWKGNRCISRVI